MKNFPVYFLQFSFTQYLQIWPDSLAIGEGGKEVRNKMFTLYPSSNKNKNNDACISVIRNPQLWATTRGWPLDSQPRVVRLRLDWVRDSCFDLRDLMPTSFWGRCVIEEEEEQYHPNYYDRAPSHFHNKFMLISWASLQFRYWATTLKPPRQSKEKN